MNKKQTFLKIFSFLKLVIFYSSSVGSVFFFLLYLSQNNPYFLLNSIALIGIHSFYYLSYWFPKFDVGDYVSFTLTGHQHLGKFATIDFKTKFYYIIRGQNGSYHKLLIHKQFLWKKLNESLELRNQKGPKFNLSPNQIRSFDQ